MINKTIVKGLNGKITVPGDKSISHRAVMFGALAEGKTTIYGFLEGEDCLSTINCFRDLGVQIKVDQDKVEILSEGISSFKQPLSPLNVGNSGTTIRLLMGILSNINFPTTLIGDSSISKRPMKRVIQPLRQMGAKIEAKANDNLTPIKIMGSQLKGIDYKLSVSSAQVKSSLLLAGLFADGITTITEPEKSRDHTERMLSNFGVEVNWHPDSLKISLKGNQKLQAKTISVPGDISSASFFIVAATIVPSSEIIIKNVGLNPTRTGLIDVLKTMGASITIENIQGEGYEPYGDIRVKSAQLKGTVIGGEIIPRLIDEIPILALAATQATGTTIIKDAQELKVKESNRIETVVNELKNMSANISSTADGMLIKGCSNLKGTKVDSHNDHRIGMMLKIASLVAEGQTIVDNEDVINISYPHFDQDLKSLLE
ncbi:3-phosphoshikimate 1-carboxyvinyltransferase [Priestia megaterium]|uniref:3-phosphoshikimate 1-carboxyvinyltransferase n=1 Tax=Priestia megaterium TaxID=1404 RepID=UPI0027302798|nr:3-phosphoshikimate 1-carboxyvinyltransferase [Priestia megaterium]MDP1471866.1 3-phosphoshikimate 1-carboxyvinyltransferase [Priestia megaterium]